MKEEEARGRKRERERKRTGDGREREKGDIRGAREQGDRRGWEGERKGIERDWSEGEKGPREGKRCR